MSSWSLPGPVRLLASLGRVLRFLCAPPSLTTLDNLSAGTTSFGYWAIINELAWLPRGKLLRVLWRTLPPSIAYRLGVVPAFVVHTIGLSARVGTGKAAADFRSSTGMSALEAFCRSLDHSLMYPSDQPGDYVMYGMHREESAPFRGRTAQNVQLRFLIDLVNAHAHASSMAVTNERFSTFTRSKKSFDELLSTNDLPRAELIALFSATGAQWAGSERKIPERDCFVKPDRGTLSQGAAVVRFDPETKRYQIQPPAVPFPAKLGHPGYPSESMSAEELIASLERLGVIAPLLLQERLIGHPAISRITGTNQLTSFRVITAQTAPGRFALLAAFLRVPTAPTSITEGWTAGGLALTVDLDNGRVTNVGTKSSFKKVTAHPFTGVPFDEVIVPFGTEIRAAALKTHEALARVEGLKVPVVGFDVALTTRGPVFMEVNCPCDLQFEKFGTPYWDDDRFADAVRTCIDAVRGPSGIDRDVLRRTFGGRS